MILGMVGCFVLEYMVDGLLDKPDSLLWSLVCLLPFLGLDGACLLGVSGVTIALYMNISTSLSRHQSEGSAQLKMLML